MEKIIHNFVGNDSSNGLLLLDMPTGSGKTYSVLRYIYESIAERKSKKKFFFITTLKKNLPGNDLRKFFKDAGCEALFDERFLRIDSNADSVKDGLTKEVGKKIPQEIKKWDEYKNLRDYVNSINSQNQSNVPKSLRKVNEDVLRKEIEPAFRKKLQLALSKAFPTVTERLDAVRSNNDWKWVAELYPAVFTKEKQIIFMSMDKFLALNSTIVEPSYMLYNSDVIKDAVIFIDEFDATKGTILDNIIENGLKGKIDFIELFKDIHAALQTHDFPADLTRPSEQRKNGEYKDQSLQSIIDGIKEKAESIYSTYSLNFSHKTKNVDESSKNFLFEDHQYHSILNGNKSYIYTKLDDTQKINSIEYGAEKPAKEENNIQVMLGKIRGFITYFQNGVRILAINYQQRRDDRRKPMDDEFTLEAALRSVLEQFRLSRANIDYLVAQILTASHKSKGGIQGPSYDLSFYENGFRYYSFEDSSDFDMQSKIRMCSFQNTPERILLRFCEKAKVIGISATATVPTNIGNFDVGYLKMKLSDHFYEVNTDDKERLRKEFEKSQNGYAGVHIHTALLGCDKYDKDAWTTVYENAELAQATYDKLEREVYESKDDSYNKKRILRIACAFKQFLLHDDMQSFLCVLTKHPRSGDRDLNFDILLEIFTCLSKKFKPGFSAKNNVEQLDGDEYDEKKDKIIKRLGKGEKIFVISVYQTIGVGQNLQYPIPSNRKEELICLNNERKSLEKDFDALYLDKPTNILVQLKDGLQEDEFVKYIYQIEYLQEACELSTNDAMKNIKKAFAIYSTGKRNTLPYENPYDRQSVALMSTKLIIQAIGRICRTYTKPKSIYIYADKNIADAMDLTVLEGRHFNYEFLALTKEVEKNRKPWKPSLAENEGNLKSIRVNKYINNMIHENWTNERIEKWKTLRKLVLKYPTVSSADLNAENRFIVENFYVRLPSESNELFYNQQEDYNNISICFERKSHDFPYAVSEEAAKLTKLMQISEIKAHFEANGYATGFARSEYIMSPALFNNIYRGALGEVVGKLLFYMYTGKRIELEEITDIELFELFDFKVPGSDIYIDFKNWHESSQFSDKEVVDKIRRKAQVCGCKCVIVANLMANGQWNISRRKMDDFELVEIPAMIDENNLKFNPYAIKEILRCVHEYSNYDK